MTTENKKGYFGEFGGSYVPEVVQKALDKLEEAYNKYKDDEEFLKEYHHYLKDYSGRETPLYFAESLTNYLGGAKIYLKREDLNHLGAHKLNNVIGQILLAKRMGKKKVIAETGAGQHGVATAAAAAKFGMQCDIYMGALDVERQRLNVFRMEMLGATVHAVEEGERTLKEAVDAAFEAWINNIDDTFYVLGSAVGPHPYPSMVKDFQRVISQEARRQILEKENHLPDMVIACVGGGSNAIGAFAEFIPDKEVKLVGVEAAGKGINTDRHAATLTMGTVGVIDGMKTYALFNEDGSVTFSTLPKANQNIRRIGEDVKKVVKNRKNLKTYGDKFFTEESSVNPRSPYSASKASADHIVIAYGETYKMPINITRCSNNYGPYHFPEKLIPLMIKNVLEGKKLPVYGKGDNVRDWLYVEDHCKGIDLVVRNGKLGEVYNIGGFNEWKNIDLIKELIKQMDIKLGRPSGYSEKLITFVKDRPGHDKRYAIDATRLNRDLGWKPSVTFEEGLAKTIDWFLENQEWLENVTSGDYQKYYEKQYHQ